MNTLFINIIMLVQVLSALTIVGLVLLQHGKGADMGAAFGSGASGSLFGATGSSNFLSKSTGVAAVIFFSATLALSYLSSNRHATISGGVLDSLPTTSAPAPATSPAVPPATSPSTTSTAPAATTVMPAPAAASAPAASAQQPAKTTPAAPQSSQIPK
ncbi:MAG TPA: preprotein translocase subunit SecG [Burkholderiaceae bacterium]|nr:preprotein translocase subunit SecG [Burkholderiaceae bacterium]